MGFADLLTDAGAAMLNSWLTTRSYIVGHSPSQADVAVYKALSSAPDAEKYPNAARWYKHISTYESEFATLPGDASKAYSVYGPEASELPVNPAKAPAAEEDEDDVDLFGSDDEEEDAEAARIREERLAEYKKKKENKPKTIAKSVVTMDVKPWDDETDMVALEASVRGIEKDGLVWGASKLVPVGFGVKKLQINLVVEDEKVSLDDLQEEISEFEDYVQSSDVVAMQKLLSPQEEEYVRQYGDLLAAYKGQWTDIDLTGSLEPPRDLFIDVRVLKDAGEIQTEYGAINLTKNSQFYVRQGDVERLIAQGYLQKLS
ncbi:Elongation factor 1-beta [Colletotrichum gloeosporioides]|uniref:Elongation factor 1-beta n=2 Tax=Colletotrichum gloeosporioides TaxID=474922 RepID=A0A8H4FIJ7_COLGL|nr:Elongation factor 1-beta [Colletotrichum gloeosporioides]KAF3803583.1 Elongation factor 1-beta [Colletotrichum gloeosporioides]